MDDVDEEEYKSYLQNEVEKIEYSKKRVYHPYLFINHSKREYVIFDTHFFENIIHKKSKSPIIMTFPNTNIVVRNIVIGLLASNSGNGRGKNELPDYDWIGMWCGDEISFENMKNTYFISHSLHSYKNISSIFSEREKLLDFQDENREYAIISNKNYVKSRSKSISKPFFSKYSLLKKIPLSH